MSKTPTKSRQTTITMGPAELEALIRRVVREESSRLVQPAPSILDDWSHEGPNDPAGDEEMLKEALEVIQQREQHGDSSVSWEEFKSAWSQRCNFQGAETRQMPG